MNNPTQLRDGIASPFRATVSRVFYVWFVRNGVATGIDWTGTLHEIDATHLVSLVSEGAGV